MGLTIKKLSKVFSPGSTNERLALNDINLTLADGEFLTVIGGNGAGKFTLLNCISGIHYVSSGSVVLDGVDITFWPEHKRSVLIGRVFQDPLLGTAFDMTIEENLAIAWAKGKSHGLQLGIKANDSKYFRHMLAKLELGLEDRLQEKVGLLSGGQRQALTLLMATLIKPRLLLLDEHTAALDPTIAATVMRLTKEFITEQGLCAIMITHNMRAALNYGTRTIMMHEGRIVLNLTDPERQNLTVENLMEKFYENSGTVLDNDRLLLG